MLIFKTVLIVALVAVGPSWTCLLSKICTSSVTIPSAVTTQSRCKIKSLFWSNRLVYYLFILLCFPCYKSVSSFSTKTPSVEENLLITIFLLPPLSGERTPHWVNPLIRILPYGRFVVLLSRRTSAVVS